MSNTLDILDKAIGLIGKIVKLIKGVNRTALVITPLAIVVAGGATFAVGRISAHPHPRPTPTLTPISVKTHKLPGVDLAGYCHSYTFDSGSEKYCSSNIDLDKACDWQYGQSGFTFKFRSSSPYSGVCYKVGKSMNGIKDMQGYCENIFNASADVEAALDGGKTWACRTKVDMELVCTWQYQKRDVEARKGDGQWRCYD